MKWLHGSVINGDLCQLMFPGARFVTQNYRETYNRIKFASKQIPIGRQ